MCFVESKLELNWGQFHKVFFRLNGLPASKNILHCFSENVFSENIFSRRQKDRKINGFCQCISFCIIALDLADSRQRWKCSLHSTLRWAARTCVPLHRCSPVLEILSYYSNAGSSTVLYPADSLVHRWVVKRLINYGTQSFSRSSWTTLFVIINSSRASTWSFLI